MYTTMKDTKEGSPVFAQKLGMKGLFSDTLMNMRIWFVSTGISEGILVMNVAKMVTDGMCTRLIT